MSKGHIQNHAAFIWSVAGLLRGNYKQSEYGKVILPLVVIRRLDCVLEPTKEAVLKRHASLKGKIANVEPVLQAVAGEQFLNTSPLDFRKLLDDPNHIGDNLRAYIGAFSLGALDVIEKFDFGAQITRLDRANLLYKVIGRSPARAPSCSDRIPPRADSSFPASRTGLATRPTRTSLPRGSPTTSSGCSTTA